MTKEEMIHPQGHHTLSSVAYFSDLVPSVLDAVAAAAVRRVYQAGTVVFVEGERSGGLYVVNSGWFKAVRMSPSGREQVLRFIGPGEVFNEVGVFADTPNPVTVVALEQAEVWIIHRDRVLKLVDQHPALARRVIETLARRALHLAKLVEDLSLRTVEARLARLLLEQASQGVLERHRWATQAEMASRLGTVLDVLNRALQQLADQGVIEVARHEIRILDPEGLQAKAMID